MDVSVLGRVISTEFIKDGRCVLGANEAAAQGRQVRHCPGSRLLARCTACGAWEQDAGLEFRSGCSSALLVGGC